MCGIAVFRCLHLHLEDDQLAQLAGDLEYAVSRSGTQAIVEVRGFKDCCLCNPKNQMVGKMEDLLENLCKCSESIIYSPNDYSDRAEECRLLKTSRATLLREHWPSLGPPTQIEVTD